MCISRIVTLLLLAGFLAATVHTSPGEQGPLDTEKSSLIASAGQVSLPSKSVTVELKLPPSGSRSRPLKEHVDGLAGDRRIFLVLKNVSAEEAPGVIFSIYLDLPAGSEHEEAQRHLAGYLNFFGLTGGRKTADRSFDITDLVRNLQKRNLLNETTTITIQPDGTPAEGAKAKIGGVEIVEHPGPARG